MPSGVMMMIERLLSKRVHTGEQRVLSKCVHRDSNVFCLMCASRQQHVLSKHVHRDSNVFCLNVCIYIQDSN